MKFQLKSQAIESVQNTMFIRWMTAVPPVKKMNTANPQTPNSRTAFSGFLVWTMKVWRNPFIHLERWRIQFFNCEVASS